MSLVDAIAGPQGDLLGLGRWWRVDHSSTPPEMVELNGRLRSAEGLRGWLERRRADGYQGMIVLNHPELHGALSRGDSRSLPAAAPVVPNLQGFMREAVEYGMLGAGWRRVMRVGPAALAGLGLRSLGRLGPLWRRDFPTMLRSFIELELADFARYDPPAVFLQAQVTDLAVALRQPRTLEVFLQAVRRRTGAHAGLCTCNPAALLAALKSWGMEAAAMIAPWDPIRRPPAPSPEACAQALRAAGMPIWADRQGYAVPPGAAERESFRKSGLIGAVRDDAPLRMAP